MFQRDIDLGGITGFWTDKEVDKITNKEEGLRFNNNKIRFDLLEPIAIEELAKVFTEGAKKYEDNNWLKGMSWNSMIASLKRHLSEYEKGIDYDNETKLLHMAHVAWNAMAIVSYYHHFPQGDDRYMTIKTPKKIGLDIDEVLADWLGSWCTYWNIERPNHWSFHRDIMEKFDIMKKNEDLDKLYLNIKPLISSSDIPFEPHCYITSRPVDTKITEQWLDNNGFPVKPVINVRVGQSKVQALKDAGVEVFIDDKYQNFLEINKAGILCYLYDAPHNRKYDVGYKRIKSLKDLPL